MKVSFFRRLLIGVTSLTKNVLILMYNLKLLQFNGIFGLHLVAADQIFAKQTATS